MSDLFYRVPRLTFLAVMVIVALGLVAFETVGRQEDPAFTNVVGFVFTQQPGADAARVETQITEPMERRLSEIAEIERLRSASRPGISTVIIELKFELSPKEVAETWSEVRDAIADVRLELPDDAFPPIFDETRIGAYTGITAIVPRAPNTPMSVMTRYAEDFRDILQGEPGVKQVRLYGQIEEEITVEIDPDAMAFFGWSPARVAQVIASADPKADAGRAVGTSGDLVVEIDGAIGTVSRVRSIPLAVSDTGGTTRVGDIAQVTRSERLPAAEYALADGRRAILVAVMMEDGLQVDTFMQDMRARMDAFEAGLPGGLEHLRLFDQSQYTTERLRDLSSRLLAGFGLVIVILFFTLGFKSALVVALALPLVTMATLATVAMMRISIDQMSVAGLIVAMGMLVDAAIVMVDEIRKRVDDPERRRQAVGDAVRRLAAPLFASTATTVLSFTPMAMMPGPPGEFLGPVATVVITMLVWSFVVACTLTPALSGWLLQPRDDARRGGLMSRGLSIGPLTRGFRGLLVFAMARPAGVVVLLMALPISGFLLAPTLVEQFFPPVERNQFYIEIEGASGASITATEGIARRIDEILAGDPRIQSRIWTIGRSAPPFYYNMVDNQERLPGYAAGLVTTISAQATLDLLGELQTRFDREFLEVRVLVRELIQGPPSLAPVEIRITGPDLETLKDLGAQALPLVSDLPMITHARDSLGSGPPKLVFELDETKVMSAGFTLDEVALELRTALDGAVGGEVIEGVARLPIRVQMDRGDRGEFDILRTLSLVAPDSGQPVSLSALGEMKIVPSTQQISRHDNERVNTLELFPQAGVLPQSILDIAFERLEAGGFELPPGYRYEIGGDTDIRAITIENMMRPIPVLITIGFAIFVLTFNSFQLALVSAFACVLFAGLSLLSVAALGFPLGIAAVVGIIGSIGVSINDTIVVLTALQDDPGSCEGDVEAMADTVVDSGRHVLSTTLTTAAGFAPLALSGGGLWPPFAAAIVGGVVLSTIVTLFLAPALFKLTYAGRGSQAVLPARI
ncbi:MAG: efflux RND transporter permease subunit [Pseudomonadota bacterium]